MVEVTRISDLRRHPRQYRPFKATLSSIKSKYKAGTKKLMKTATEEGELIRV
jgi:hypothetical protein